MVVTAVGESVNARVGDFLFHTPPTPVDAVTWDAKSFFLHDLSTIGPPQRLGVGGIDPAKSFPRQAFLRFFPVRRGLQAFVFFAANIANRANRNGFKCPPRLPGVDRATNDPTCCRFIAFKFARFAWFAATLALRPGPTRIRAGTSFWRVLSPILPPVESSFRLPLSWLVE